MNSGTTGWPEEVGEADAGVCAVTAMTFLILMCKIILSIPSGLNALQ